MRTLNQQGQTLDLARRQGPVGAIFFGRRLQARPFLSANRKQSIRSRLVQNQSAREGNPDDRMSNRLLSKRGRVMLTRGLTISAKGERRALTTYLSRFR